MIGDKEVLGNNGMELGLKDKRNVKVEVKWGRQHVHLQRSLTEFLIFCCIQHVENIILTYSNYCLFFVFSDIKMTCIVL